MIRVYSSRALRQPQDSVDSRPLPDELRSIIVRGLAQALATAYWRRHPDERERGSTESERKDSA